jgi:4-hydroxybenzoate polyprenyltransferase
LRPLDWLKNLFVLAPLLFSGCLIDYPLAAKSLLGFLLFCILSSGAYLFNDLMDREEDRRHPAKALRPIASGLLPPSMAGGISFGLILVGLIGASALDLRFGMVAFVFSLLHLAYSIGLKDWVIVDVLLIAAGFVLRVLAGSALVAVLPSAWIILCTMLLSVFLGFSKRRHELVLLGGQAKAHRKVLEQYSLAFLDQMIGAVLAATVVSYALYTINNGPLQIYSVFFVLYGMFRYLYLIHHRGHGGRAAESFLTDRPLLATVLGWTLFMLWDIYLRG